MMSVQMQAAVSRVSLNGDDQSPVAAIRISSNQTLSVCRRHNGGAALRLTAETVTDAATRWELPVDAALRLAGRICAQAAENAHA
jgi:hypothetical protein